MKISRYCSISRYLSFPPRSPFTHGIQVLQVHQVIRNNDRLLAILVNVPASIISEKDFIDVSQPLLDFDSSNTDEVL